MTLTKCLREVVENACRMNPSDFFEFIARDSPGPLFDRIVSIGRPSFDCRYENVKRAVLEATKDYYPPVRGNDDRLDSIIFLSAMKFISFRAAEEHKDGVAFNDALVSRLGGSCFTGK